MSRTERRYRYAVDVTILVLAVTFVGLACGLLFAPDWLFTNARWVFGGLAFGWAASFSWLLTAAAWSVKGLPAHEIAEPSREARVVYTRRVTR